MDLYGSPEFGIDDLLDFSNDELFSSSSSSAGDTSSLDHRTLPSLSSSNVVSSHHQSFFAADLCFPSDNDVAELEWLSRFVGDEDDNSNNNMAFFAGATIGSGNSSHAPSKAICRSARSKRSSRSSPAISRSSVPLSEESSPPQASATRRCTHCLSEKTPQWRTGPMGPKTLCNACGVRFKSGRLVPEYRPAASPTFVLTQHSNSHRKVMELRRQKEISRHQSSSAMAAEQDEQGQGQFYPQQHGFRVC